MSKYKSLALLLVAVVFSGVAGYLSIIYLEKREQALIAEFDEKANYTEVIVPNQDLLVGDKISIETVSVRPVPATYIPAGTLFPQDFDAIAGLTIKEPAPAGRPLLRGQLDGLTGVEKFSQLLKEGERALTLPISTEGSFENMLVPGDRVDILVKVRKKDEEGVTVSALMDNVLVLATGVFTVADPTYFRDEYMQQGYASITIGVNTRDISKLISAGEVGDLVYLLRNPEDDARGRFQEGVDLFGEGSGNGVRIYSRSNVEGGLLGISYQASTPVSANRWGSKSDPGRLYKKFVGGGGSDKEEDVKMGISQR